MHGGILSIYPDTIFYTFGTGGNPNLLKMQIKATENIDTDLFFTNSLEAVKILLKNEHVLCVSV